MKKSWIADQEHALDFTHLESDSSCEEVIGIRNADTYEIFTHKSLVIENFITNEAFNISKIDGRFAYGLSAACYDKSELPLRHFCNVVISVESKDFILISFYPVA